MFTSFFTKLGLGLAKVVAVPIVMILSLAGYQIHPNQVVQPTVEESFGSGNNAVGGKTYFLSGSGISTSQTTVGLTNFDVAGGTYDLTMSDFGDLGCATIEPGNSTRQEFISFTGVTQNADDTATLTGVTRGLSPVPPYTASTTQQKQHSGASSLVISNSPPCFYESYANLGQNEAVTGTWTFNSHLPTSSITATIANQFVIKSLLDATTNQGAATSTESNGGIVELGTLAEQASSFDDGVSKPTVLQTKNSTSTCQVVGSYNIVASTTTGKLDKNCFDQTANYALTGLNTFSATTTFNGGVDIDADINSPVIFNGLEYTMPTIRAASSTVLAENGSGNLTFNSLGSLGSPYLIMATTTAATAVGSNSTIVSFTPTIPAGLLGTTGAIEVTVYVSAHIETSGATAGSVTLILGGTTACTVATTLPQSSPGFPEVIHFFFYNNASAAVNNCLSEVSGGSTSGVAVGKNVGTTINTASALSVVMSFTQGDSDQTFTVTGARVMFMGKN